MNGEQNNAVRLTDNETNLLVELVRQTLPKAMELSFQLSLAMASHGGKVVTPGGREVPIGVSPSIAADMSIKCAFAAVMEIRKRISGP